MLPSDVEKRHDRFIHKILSICERTDRRRGLSTESGQVWTRGMGSKIPNIVRTSLMDDL